MDSKIEKKGFLFGLCAVFLWSINFIIIKKGVEIVDPVLLTFYRLVLALPFMFFFKPKKAIPIMFLVTIIWNVGGFNLIALGLYYNVSATSAAFLQQSNSVFLLILSFLFLNEKKSLNKFIYLAFSFIGIFIFFIPSLSTVDFTFGAFFILLSSFLWALGMILFKKFNVDGSLGTVIWMAGLASIAQAPLTYFFVPAEKIIFSTEVLLYALSAFVLSSIFANALWLKATVISKSDSLSYLVLLTPIIVLIADSYIMDNSIKINHIVGGIIIILSGLYRFLLFIKSKNMRIKIENL
jgi:drug/metabolite transporter (DMT)-like permease